MNGLSRITKLILILTITVSATASAEPLKPRVVVLTDVSTWETDDSESLVRLLVHADLLEIEGWYSRLAGASMKRVTTSSS
ncbi:hypothetical protein NHH03_04565 [Stieleria sp. TO1_6]|nr:nucleoside hydrolase-like domain-containing protein [Stieleria tagensis]MCO8121000.1 hypothetical protein [Stieleria tagensis]